jgi:hypothetical protein
LIHRKSPELKVAVDILANRTVALSYIAHNKKPTIPGKDATLRFRLPEAAARVKLDSDQP